MMVLHSPTRDVSGMFVLIAVRLVGLARGDVDGGFEDRGAYHRGRAGRSRALA
jgi:hypothetical protein